MTSCVTVNEAVKTPDELDAKEVVKAIDVPVDCEKEKAATKKRSREEEDTAAWNCFMKNRPKGESTTLDHLRISSNRRDS